MNSDKNIKGRPKAGHAAEPKTGQGFNDARGEIPDKEDIPEHNGQNLNNDPAHHRANEHQTAHSKEENV